MISTKNSALKKAVCEYKKITSNERKRMLIQAREDAWRDEETRKKAASMDDKAERMKGGLKKGEKKRNIEIAKKMILKNKNISKYLVDQLGKYKFNTIVINCYSFKECNEAKGNPVIIHYADKKKPWKEITPYYSEWWKHAEKSPVYEEIKETYKLTPELENAIKNKKQNNREDKINKKYLKAA